MACSGLAEDQLAASVQTYLGLLLFENAKFLCERLVASCASEVHHAGPVKAPSCRVVDMHQLLTRSDRCTAAGIDSMAYIRPPCT